MATNNTGGDVWVKMTTYSNSTYSTNYAERFPPPPHAPLGWVSLWDPMQKAWILRPQIPEQEPEPKPEPRRSGMNNSLAVFLINDHARAVMCTYEADKEHALAPRTMFKTLDPSIKVGDYVVIPTDTRHKMTVVKVAEVDVEPDIESSAKVDWIIGVVDRADHDALLEQEKAAIEKITQAQKLKKKQELRASLLALDEEQMKSLPLADLREAPAIGAGTGKPAE